MVEDETLIGAAGRIADGEMVDWASITSSLHSDHDRAIADELAVVAQIAAGHRQLHQLLPVATDTPPNLMADRARWGHLDLLNIVGRGSYGTVYRAWDTRLERLVALKLFHGASNPDTVMQEGRMLARVRHENVVTVYGADVIDGVAGIWMELVHGKTLDNLVKGHGVMTARAAAAVGVDVARALAAVHAAGLLHCDVKAQNVVRETTGRVVLMDLGAGRVAPEPQDGDQLSDIAGTPRYMAPELFRPGAAATKASDLYSFGVLLYFLVSGRFPVDGKTLGELKRAHAAGEVHPLASVAAGLPAALVDVVSRAVDRDPSRRPESAGEIQTSLAPLAADAASVTRAPRSIGWWVAAAAGVGMVALLTIARPMLTPPAPPAPAIRSIAVLPIRNLTGDPSKAYIADGLSELLIANLARVRSLRVPSFAAVAPLRDTIQPPSVTTKQLGVDLLLSGAIVQAGDEFRLTVQLAGADGTAVWGDEVTRGLGAIISAQADVTRRIVEQLALTLTDDSSNLSSQAALSPKAQEAYLRGLSLRTSSITVQREAAQAFREVVELEPGFADAWGQLALIEAALAERSAAIDRAQSTAIARQLAARAISLDPRSASGLAALATVKFYGEFNFQEAEEGLRAALEANPSASFLMQRYAMVLAAMSRLDEAVALAREAQRLEPTLAMRSTSLGILLYYARKYDEAAREMNRALLVTPAYPLAYFGLGKIASAQGRHAEAIRQLQRALAGSMNSVWLSELARAYAAANRPDDVSRVLAQLRDRERNGDGFSPDNLAYIAVAEGRFDEAFSILEDAIERRLANVLWIAVDPRVDPLRADPRFKQLIAKLTVVQ